MLFLISAAALAATVFLFLYGVQLSQHEALPRWAKHESVLTGGALGFTLIVPLALMGMLQGAPGSSTAIDLGIATAVAATVSVAARLLAVYFANGGRRRKRVRV